MSYSDETYDPEEYRLADMDIEDVEPDVSDMDISGEEYEASDMDTSDDDDFQQPINIASSSTSHSSRKATMGVSASSTTANRASTSTAAKPSKRIQQKIDKRETTVASPATFFSTTDRKGKSKAVPMEFSDDDDFQQPINIASSSTSHSSRKAIMGVSASSTTASRASSSTAAKPSKRIQRKVDKREAVEQKRQQKRAGKKAMKCSSCGRNDHAKPTSRLCPNYKKKVEDGFYIRQFTIKTSLQDFCPNERLRGALKKLVPYFSKLMCVMSLFANYIVLENLNSQQPVADLDQQFIYKLLITMTGNRKHESIVNLWQRFCRETGTRTFENKQLSTALSTIAKQYETDIKNSICATYQKRSINFIKRSISNRNGEFYINANKKRNNAMAWYIRNTILGSRPTWPDGVDQTNEARNAVNDLVLLYISYCKVVPKEANIYAHPTEHLPWLLFILKDVEAIQYQITQRAATRAPRSHIILHLKSSVDTTSFPPKSIQSLVHSIASHINNNKDIETGSKKLRVVNAEQWRISYAWCADMKGKLASGTLAMPVYDYQRSNHLYTLLPVYNASPKHIHIDKQTFWKLLKDSFLRQTGSMNDTLIAKAYRDHFKFRKLSDKKNFNYTFSTDGYSVCLHYQKAIASKPKDAQPFIAKCLRDKISISQIWGIDPVISSIMTATDNHNESRSISNAEYYSLLKVESGKSFLEKYNREHAAAVDLLKSKESLKVTDTTIYLEAVKENIQHFQTIYDYHAYAPKLKFKRYIAKQQALDEMCKMLDDNKSRKYKDRGQKEMTKIFAFGAASFSSSLKGNKAAPTRSFKSALKSYAFANKHYFIEVDEYLTSQVCNICQTRTLENLFCKEKKEKLHAVLRCTNCCQVYNRDINASINIRDVFTHMALNDNTRPQAFQKDKEE